MRRAIFIVSILCFLLTGCSRPKPPIVTLSAAAEYFQKICREEYKYNVKIIPSGKTLWIYVPLTDGIVSLRAAPKNDAPKAPAEKGWTINFIEGVFDRGQKSFNISYDITQSKRYDKTATYQNKYSEDFTKKQRDILTAVTRAYFDVGTNIKVPLKVGTSKTDDSSNESLAEKMKPDPKILEETPPDFFVLVFADIKRGVAIKGTSYFQDMKMALSYQPALTSEEFGKRYVNELYGDEELIGDSDGTHLKVSDIRLEDFLAKQIENRVKFAFAQSDFTPEGEVRDHIWEIVSETFRLYQFHAFEKIKLNDLQDGKESIYDKSQL